MQYNALLHPSHLYPDVWNEFPLEGGSWVGFYRLDLPFELDDDVVHQIKQAILMSDVIQIRSSVWAAAAGPPHPALLRVQDLLRRADGGKQEVVEGGALKPIALVRHAVLQQPEGHAPA